jgi:hypothetical protein
MKYIRVDEAPQKLNKNEMVITKPNFMEEVEKTKGRRGVEKLTTVNALRDTFMAITDKYDNKLNPYKMPLQKYRGRAFQDDKEYSDIILKIIKDNDYDLIDKAVDTLVKQRSTDVDKIYYVSPDLEGTKALTQNGFSLDK